ncbi:MAG: permease [Bacteroidales bacterium]|nr:permease [Bacteroidales bacterium]
MIIEYITGYLNEFLYLLLEMAPWLLLGFLFAGLLHVYMPHGSVRKYMGKNNLKSVLYSVLLGIPLPLCSCGVIPTGISFYKEGASKGSTVAFLISTPQTGVDSILATYSLLGLPFALLRPVVAFFSGILGGIFTNLNNAGEIDVSKPEKTKPELQHREKSSTKFRKMFRYAFVDFMEDIADWLIIGLAVAALISMVLPDNFFTLYLDNQFLSMLVVLAASIPIYVCATGSIPIAAVLMMKGLSPGAALVFLMAGPATNAATMAVITKAIDKKTLINYLVSIIGSALLFGYLTNQFLPVEWFTFAISEHGAHQHELLPRWLQIISAAILGVAVLNIYYRKFFVKNKSEIEIPMSEQINQVNLKVKGMTCNHCKANVEKSIASIKGIEFVEANPDKDEVIVRGDNVDLDAIQKSVENIGYTYEGKA